MAQSAVPQNHTDGYFENIYKSIKSIYIGMRITLKYLFSKPVTICYPYEKLAFAPRYRGIHEFEIDRCIACDSCAKACPVDCIYIDKEGPRKINKETGIVDPGGNQLLRYAIDYQKCMFCALCTEPCPTECIHMGKNHDMSAFSRQEMIIEFTELAEKGMKTAMPIWAERNAPKIPWVAKEKARIEAGILATTEADIPSL